MSPTSSLRRAITGAVAVLVAVGSLALFAPAAHAAEPCSVGIANYESTAVITTNTTTVTPGQTITITGSGFPPNSEVPLSAGGVGIGTALTDAAGGFVFSYVVPANATTESISISANCGTAFSLSTAVAISGVQVNNSNALPVTGSSSTLPLVEGAIVLVVVGGLILLLVRRRSNETVAA